MSSQAFFWLNLGAALILVFIFIVGRKNISAKPSKLNLRKGVNTEDGLIVQEASEQSEKTLNVMFMFNGHSFDAHEVLGCPAGANIQMVEDYFNQAMARKGSDRAFLEAAFSAIKDRT
jgi:hypothetical protein